MYDPAPSGKRGRGPGELYNMARIIFPEEKKLMSEQSPRPQLFNPNEHLIQIKGRNGSADYLPVQWRLVWFRSLCPDGTIETEIVHLDLDRETEEESYVWNSETRRSEKVTKRARGFAVFRAVVKDGRGGIAVGTKSERAVSFPDYIEKAETGAIGRALAALGYGTQFTGDEFDEQHRIVDAPVERRADEGERHAAVKEPDPNGPVTKDQVASIAKLCRLLGKQVARPANFRPPRNCWRSLIGNSGSQRVKADREEVRKSCLFPKGAETCTNFSVWAGSAGTNMSAMRMSIAFS